MTYISVDMQQLQQNHLINIFRYYWF
jgi:hypothetical protein